MASEKISVSRHRTLRSQLVADQIATGLFTLMGLGVIAAVIGMVVFFAATILPLFEGVQVRPLVAVPSQMQVEAFIRDPDAPLLAIVSNDDNSCFLQIFVVDEGVEQPSEVSRLLREYSLFWTEAAPDSGHQGLSLMPRGDQLSPSEYGCGRVENSTFLLTDAGPTQRQALVKLSLVRRFVQDDHLRGLSSEVLARLTEEGWAVVGDRFYAKASPEAPVSFLEPQLSLVAEWKETAGDQESSEGAKAPLSREWSDATFSGVGRVASDGRTLLFLRGSGGLRTGVYLISEQENFLTGVTESSVEYRELPSLVDRVIKLSGDQGIALVSEAGRLAVVSWDELLSSSKTSLGDLLSSSEVNLVPSGGLYVASVGGFGGSTVVVIDDAGRCTAYDLPFFMLHSDGKGLKPRWQSRCLSPTESPLEIIGSPSQRLVLIRTGSGLLRGLDLTSGELVTETGLGDDVVGDDAIQFERNGRYLLVQNKAGFTEWEVDSEYLQGSLERLFGRIHYEGYEEPSLSWQSASASDDFESKFSLWPLIWGTLKATLYSMLFAAPLGIAAAVYSSEMLDRRTRNFVKPGIEMMASLPSVVLGYLAAIVLAPWIESNILGVILCGLVVPCMLYFLGNVVAEYSAKLVSGRGLYANRRLLVIILSGFLLSLGFLLWAGNQIEKLAFAGDLKAYLSGGEGSAGVMYGILFLPLVLFLLWSVPVGRRFGKLWRTLVFLFGPALAMLIGTLLHDDLGSASLEVAGYSQRNALVICVAMGFAIIPIIYSLSEDALTSVPGSLRAGSLACGASVWQTTARVVLPTAASGIFSALMVGFGRAIGETMIVVMATGNSPVMSINPFEGLRTLSANIAVELPEAPVGGTHYRILFFSGFVLFLLTFCLNTLAELMRSRYRNRNKAL